MSRARSLAGLSTLLRVLLAKRFRIMIRYRVNFLAQMAGAYLFFAVIFFGGQAAVGRFGSPGALDGTFEGVIVGWFLYLMAQASYFGLAGNITKESEWGTLEQLYMSPYGFGPVVGVLVVVNVIASVFGGIVILALMLVTTGRSLTIDVVTLVPIVLLGLLSVVGVGFVVGGMALIYKRVESVSQLMQFGLVGLIAAPVAGLPALRLLPLVQSSAMLQETMRNGTRLWEFPPTDLAVLTVTAGGYLIAGYLVFRICSRIARRRGVMGHY